MIQFPIVFVERFRSYRVNSLSWRASGIPFTYLAFMIPATREGATILPFRRDGSFSRRFMAQHFVAAVNVGGFLYDFKLRGDEFQALYGFLCNNLIFRIAVRAVTLCPRQLVLGHFGCLKRGKVFFFAVSFSPLIIKIGATLKGYS